MAAPKGNKYAEENLQYKSLKELSDVVEEYFNYCDNKTKEVHSEKLGTMIMPDPEPYTMSGLAYALGLSRQGLLNYSNKDKFVDTIKRARQRVEADVERRMNGKDTFTAGLIFNAKNNFGWKDKTENETTLRLPKPIMDVSDALPANNRNIED